MVSESVDSTVGDRRIATDDGRIDSGRMAEGTRNRKMEARMEAVEFEMHQTQEAMTQTWEELIGMKELIKEDSDRNREALEQYGQRLNSVLGMLSSLPQFQLSPEFPPRGNSEPLLPNQDHTPNRGQSDLEESHPNQEN